ncbi:MAG TPA: glycoside hydrolase family 57 protein [Terriglobales bacterium]|nr:glycoside hydrolase family 57 protein [Terriglobales bacterium]
MSEPSPVDLLFLWHHHQPDYRSPRENRALLPWVRLHATKDYLDMALHLERHPQVHATFNFVPSLLDQLEEAAAGGRESLFDLFAKPVEALSETERATVLARCVAAPRHAMERWPRYRALTLRVARSRGSGVNEPTATEVLALECWFLLAWLDPLLDDEPEAAAALATGGDFSEEERAGLLALYARTMGRVIPAYRALAERGQIELSESAYYHPILPLVVDVRAARRSRPDLPLPAEPFAAPEDAERQIVRAFERHTAAFGAPPAGMWPPEGGVSPEAAALAAQAGARWLGTDEGVLWQSLPPGERQRALLYQPWRYRTAAGDVALFFRDHELSDRIGFVYQHWDTADAVADFLGRLRRVGREQALPGRRPVVAVILDGENCWENYTADGGPFLEALYSALESDPEIRTVTPSEVLRETPPTADLPTLHSGSWIDADFHIWIGHPEKNRAWELLARARRALHEARRTPENCPGAWDALHAAEGSDWFWWFGEDHFTADKGLFDRIFREHLQAVYERAGLAVPTWLHVAVARFTRRPDLATQPLGFVRPTIDGRSTHFFEWYAAGRHRLGAGGSSMHREAGLARDLYFGFDASRFYLRLDFTAKAPPGSEYDLLLDFLAPQPVRILVQGLVEGSRPMIRRGDQEVVMDAAAGECRLASVLELGLGFESLGLKPGDAVDLLIQLMKDGEPVESLPTTDLVRFTVPDASYEAMMWSA